MAFMCGRYKQTAEEKEYLKQFGYLGAEEYFDIHGYRKKPEIFPGEWITTINNARKHEDIWWTIEDFDYNGIWRKAINARAENVVFADMFKGAFRNDRVLIPATALFEWQTQPNKTKKRFEISFGESIFAFGGLARVCQIKVEQRRCGVIITTRPNDIFAEIHNVKQRQAVVIHQYDYDKWLDPETTFDELQALMEPVSNEETYAKQCAPTIF